jgi:NAD+ diphosphatase
MVNPTQFFKFCPNCGSQNLSYQNNFKLNCFECEFVLYHNVAAAVAMVFTFEDKILFTVRNVEPDSGKLDLPGGFIDPNETAETAICREIEEELGLVLDRKKLVYSTSSPNNYLYKNVAYRTLDMFFEYQLSSEHIEIKAKDEIQKLIWIPKKNINLSEIAFESVRQVISEKYLDFN